MTRVPAFRLLAALTAVCAYLQISLGGVVRVSGSGLGCEDQWPLCNGHPYPALEVHAVIEYAHRTFGALTSLLMLATAVAAWAVYRRRRPLVAWFATAAVAVVALEIPLGALVVFKELAGVLVLAHLAVALAILGLLVATAALATPVAPAAPDASFQRLALALVGATYLLLLTGSAVVASGADDRCHSWPLCGGGLQPQFGGVDAFTMVHRFGAALAGLLLLYVLAGALRRFRAVPGLPLAAALTLAAFLVQALLVGPGAALAVSPALFDGLHVAFATAVWAGVCATAAVAWRRPEREDVSARLELRRTPA
jgi:heme a synthase